MNQPPFVVVHINNVHIIISTEMIPLFNLQLKQTWEGGWVSSISGRARRKRVEGCLNLALKSKKKSTYFLLAVK